MEFRELILRNHRAWLRGMLENLEDLGSLQGDALDIAESANQEDFDSCALDGIAHEWLDRTSGLVSIGEIGEEQISLNWEYTNKGLEITVLQCEGVADDDPIFLAQKEKWDTFIPWSEFDYQKDCTHLAENSISAINTIDFEKIAGEGAHDWSWSLNKDGDKYVLWSWADGCGDTFFIYKTLSEAKKHSFEGLFEEDKEAIENAEEILQSVKNPEIHVKNQSYYFEKEGSKWSIINSDCTSNLVSDKIQDYLDEIYDLRDSDDEFIVVDESSIPED